MKHKNYARHIYANWKKVHNDIGYKELFWKVVYSTYEPKYKAKLKVLKEKNAETADGFVRRDPNLFCKAFILTECRCDSADNNMVETFNGWILEARFQSIITMLNAIRLKVMERIKVVSDFANTWQTLISPVA